MVAPGNGRDERRVRGAVAPIFSVISYFWLLNIYQQDTMVVAGVERQEELPSSGCVRREQSKPAV